MDVVLGIDVGTQSCKCVALDAAGKLCGIGQQRYGVLTPRPHWAEQEPETWWEAAVAAVHGAMSNIPADRVRGIGLTGQMHGVVLLNRQLEPLHPAIIWMDRRSANLCSLIQSRVPRSTVINVAANRLSPGFAGATLAWLREVEPKLLGEIRAVIQPKDYLALRLTGEVSSDHSDASATWLYDIKQRRWSDVLTAACGVSLDILPPLSDSSAVVGSLRSAAASALGLPADLPVVAGSSDQAALLLGTGVIEPGRGVITLATGGQMTIVSRQPMIDRRLRLNTFCHSVPDLWYTMGAILNGGMALRWWRSLISTEQPPSYNDLLADAARVPAGAEGLTFIPYLEGERTPHMDPDASGAFVGLTLRHTQAHITRAVLEGVAYAFRDCFHTLQAAGPVPDHFLIGGGGAQGALWRQIMASVLGISLQTITGTEHTATGAAMLAGLGTQVFYDFGQAVAHTVHYGSIEIPNPDDRPVYNEGYARFRALYPALKAVP